MSEKSKRIIFLVTVWAFCLGFLLYKLWGLTRHDIFSFSLIAFFITIITGFFLIIFIADFTDPQLETLKTNPVVSVLVLIFLLVSIYFHHAREAVMVLLSLMVLAFGIHGIVTGTVRFGGYYAPVAKINRYENPFQFWFAVMFYLIGGAFLLAAFFLHYSPEGAKIFNTIMHTRAKF